MFGDTEQCVIIINVHFGDSQIFENDLKGFKTEIPSSILRFWSSKSEEETSIYIFFNNPLPQWL